MDLFRAHQPYMPPSPAFMPSFAAGPAALRPSVARFGEPVYRGSLLASRRTHQEWDRNALPCYTATPIGPSSFLEETVHHQSVGSCRMPVRERLSRPSFKKRPLGVRHSPLDQKMSTAFNIGAGSDSTKYFEPKRVLIGKDEYIRSGKGNKLVRIGSKLNHMASEKARWSWHNTRLKLAKKQQYCLFFTRFGTCDNENGKCPYIHDPDKISICTKFLKGLCFGPNCKFTHKVIPERMQDCSYFLQGLCTNDNCPYRHVNVNPKASVCEGFLRGYCADGNECRKKHTYVCPHFEEKGVCPLGPLCKRYHPNKSSKYEKRKCIEERRNGRGRYFDCLMSPVSENQTAETGGGSENIDDLIILPGLDC